MQVGSYELSPPRTTIFLRSGSEKFNNVYPVSSVNGVTLIAKRSTVFTEEQPGVSLESSPLKKGSKPRTLFASRVMGSGKKSRSSQQEVTPVKAQSPEETRAINSDSRIASLLPILEQLRKGSLTLDQFEQQKLRVINLPGPLSDNDKILLQSIEEEVEFINEIESLQEIDVKDWLETAAEKLEAVGHGLKKVIDEC